MSNPNPAAIEAATPTPRVDGEYAQYNDLPGKESPDSNTVPQAYQAWDFARQLERELAAAKTALAGILEQRDGLIIERDAFLAVAVATVQWTKGGNASPIYEAIAMAQREVLEDVKPLLDALTNSYDALEWPTNGISQQERARDGFVTKYALLLSDSEREGK